VGDMLRDRCSELDEVIFAGNHEQANLMKALTTEPKGTKEEKYGKKRPNQKRWFNIGAPGNTFHLNKTESDGRRDFYVTASEEHTGPPTKEWAAHCKNLKQDKYVLPLARFLYERKLPEDWWAQSFIPQNKALAEQKILSMTPVEHVLKTWIERGYILENYDDSNNKQGKKDMLAVRKYRVQTRISNEASGTDHDVEVHLETIHPGGIFTPQQVPVSLSCTAKEPTPLKRVYTFGHPLPKTEVYMSAIREFGTQRDFPKTSNAFFIALEKTCRKDPKFYEASKNHRRFYKNNDAEATRVPAVSWRERTVTLGTAGQDVRQWWDTYKFVCFSATQ
jgi:hypothetical protein